MTAACNPRLRSARSDQIRPKAAKTAVTNYKITQVKKRPPPVREAASFSGTGGAATQAAVMRRAEKR